jgi:RNA recognition motif-containing protein
MDSSPDSSVQGLEIDNSKVVDHNSVVDLPSPGSSVVISNSATHSTYHSSASANKQGSASSQLQSGVSQQTRHARRIYVGGIPPGYADEELLKAFLNNVISKGLNEENDNSYVLSVYINQKKFFAFVEFKSIELTTACLELDGLIYHTSALKILRANEYKPELVPPPTGPPIKLHLPASCFGTPMAGLVHQIPTSEPTEVSTDQRLDYTYIQVTPVTSVERNSIALIGFPYDDSTRKASGRAGSSVSPKAIRNILRKNGAGALVNPEFNIDMSSLAIFDIGDVAPGLPMEEANHRLASLIIEVVRRGGIPFVIGGSCELCYGLASGLIAVTGGSLGIVSVSSQLDVKPAMVSIPCCTACFDGLFYGVNYTL